MSDEAANLRNILKKKSKNQDILGIWNKLPGKTKIYVFEVICDKKYADLGEF